MILDALLQFDSAVSLAIAAGTQVSTNVIDLGITSGIPTSASGGGARDIGIGDDPAMKLLVQVVTTFTSGGAGTLAAALQGAIDNGSGAPAAFSTWYTSPTYALATLVAGERLLDMDMPRPPAGIAIPRFLRLNYTVGTATMTAGAVTSYIVLDRDDQIYNSTNNATLGGYAAGVVVAN
jgi:hypothetical protein